MDQSTLAVIGVLLVIGAAWTFVNLKTTDRWLAVVSLTFLLISFGGATWLAFAAAMGWSR